MFFSVFGLMWFNLASGIFFMIIHPPLNGLPDSGIKIKLHTVLKIPKHYVQII